VIKVGAELLADVIKAISLKTPAGGILSAMGIFVRRDKPA
jgi:hypothetical protein